MGDAVATPNAVVCEVGFDVAGRSAQISAPLEAGIRNDSVSSSGKNGGANLLLRPELLRIQIPGSKAFASPTGSETELATLVADQIAVVLGIATDGSRLRIVGAGFRLDQFHCSTALAYQRA